MASRRAHHHVVDQPVPLSRRAPPGLPNRQCFTQANPTNLTIGAGYTGGNWPAEPHYQQNGSTGYPDYFTGQLADITLPQ